MTNASPGDDQRNDEHLEHAQKQFSGKLEVHDEPFIGAALRVVGADTDAHADADDNPQEQKDEEEVFDEELLQGGENRGGPAAFASSSF